MGGILLKLRRLTATFGRLNSQTLELGEGLNILQAPNETGKSTWCAFLMAMLYGIDSRQRDKAGFIADKNRYAPWSGAAMSGRLDCLSGQDALTLTRETKRQTAPMGQFSARYTGTGDEFPGLTAQNCGEQLSGVPREVFERSAFIRQSGLGVTQDAELERRIVSLITTGEEDTSYIETAAALKKQLNRRRHNKTGELPAAEAELTEVRRQLEQLQERQQALSRVQEESELLTRQQAQLEQRLSLRQQYDAIQKRKRLQDSLRAGEKAETIAAALRRRAEEERIPQNDAIARLRGAIVNLETVRRSVDKARSERDEALKARLRAESAVNDSPFAGMSVEDARKETETPPKVSIRMGPSLAVFSIGLILAVVFFLLVVSRYGAYLTGWTRALPWAGLAAIIAGVMALSHQMRRHAVKSARTAALTKRFGTADAQEISALADAYTLLIEQRSAAQADAAGKSATADALYASLSSNEQGILLEVRRFAPAAFDIPAADAALRECAVRRRELSEAESLAREARVRHDVLAQQQPDVTPLTEAELTMVPPADDGQALESALAQVRNALAVQTSAADRLSGEIAAMGDPAVLCAQREQLENAVERLGGEYDAIALAMEALDGANTTLQNRFSPALGHRAAEIFRELTDGRYTGVVLDRSFRLSAEPAGDTLYRDAQLLSAGAVDQLYLAVRLAICELVLPAEDCPPLILDDALTNFDDQRCAAALRWLRKEAERRQILLFTCHSREGAFFTGDPAVAVQELTEAPLRV